MGSVKTNTRVATGDIAISELCLLCAVDVQRNGAAADGTFENVTSLRSRGHGILVEACPVVQVAIPSGDGNIGATAQESVIALVSACAMRGY